MGVTNNELANTVLRTDLVDFSLKLPDGFRFGDEDEDEPVPGPSGVSGQ
jgi:hypothetical protein